MHDDTVGRTDTSGKDLNIGRVEKQNLEDRGNHKSRFIRWTNTWTVVDLTKLRKCKRHFVKYCSLQSLDLNSDRIF